MIYSFATELAFLKPSQAVKHYECWERGTARGKEPWRGKELASRGEAVPHVRFSFPGYR